MRTRSKTPTAGVVTRLLDKKPGRPSRSGCGTCGWNWVMCLSRLRYARPPLLPPYPRPEGSSPPPRAMASPRLPPAGCAGRFSGQDFALQPDGTLRCPAKQSLVAHERRKEADGSLRVVSAASIRSCRPCPLRHQCQWEGSATKKPRQVSVLLHPLQVGPAPLRLRAIGAAESTGMPVCSSYDTNVAK
jgi:hypothetical protein